MTNAVNGRGIDILMEEGEITPEERYKMLLDNPPKGVKAVHMGNPDGVEDLISTIESVLGEGSIKEMAVNHFKMGLAICRSNMGRLSEEVDRREVIDILTNVMDVAEKGAITEGAPELRVCMTLLAFVDSFMNHPVETLEGIMEVLNRINE